MIHFDNKKHHDRINNLIQPNKSSSQHYIHISQLKYMMPWSMNDFDISSVKSQNTIGVLNERKDLLKNN